MWTFSISNDYCIIRGIFVWFRVALEIRLESYGPSYCDVYTAYTVRVTAMYILQAHIYIANCYVTTPHNKLTGLTTGYYTTKDGLTANDASFNFHKNKVG